MNIRQATVEDATIIAQLNGHVQQVHVDAEPAIYKQVPVNDDWIAYYAEAIEDGAVTIYLVEDNGIAVGYIYIIVQERSENLFTYERRYVLVDQMSVNPDYYGTGVAEQLMDCALAMAREHNMNQIILGVRDWNIRARKFYEKQGFKTSHHRMQLVLE